MSWSKNKTEKKCKWDGLIVTNYPTDVNMKVSSGVRLTLGEKKQGKTTLRFISDIYITGVNFLCFYKIFNIVVQLRWL